ncbi:hypothetical protein DPMN_157679 [Dreissena polymorpha]|uniref:Uncharacterized protein n=1 Tax=Dreissena polymorpha TaxID=45954 RepID=A0A9D4IL97_DREPO|nr:hypothetical protein DPMN_157679 [Dreissena polymorpha]
MRSLSLRITLIAFMVTIVSLLRLAPYFVIKYATHTNVIEYLNEYPLWLKLSYHTNVLRRELFECIYNRLLQQSIQRLRESSQKGPSPLDLARTYCQNYVDPPGFEVKTVNDVIALTLPTIYSTRVE